MKAAARLLLFLLITSAMFAQDSGKIFVVRHAEKRSAANDTPLSRQGEARAECLGQTLQDAHIGRVFVTQYVRTKQTAAAVMRESKAKETEIDSQDYDKFVTAATAAAKSGNVLIVAHSNTIPLIMSAFGTPAVTIPDTAYDLLFVLDARDPKRLTTLHYCPNLPPDSGVHGPNSMAKP